MNQPIRVLQLVASFSAGGAERLILGMLERIDRTRFSAHVCGLTVLSGNVLQPAFERTGIPVTLLHQRKLYDPRGFRRLAEYVRAHRIEVIHTHLTSADIMGRLVGRALGVSVVSTLHNEPHDYERQRFDWRMMQRLTARWSGAELIAVAERIRTMYMQRWGIPSKQIRTIYNAVPFEPYLAVPVDRRNGGEGAVITTIGRLSEQKAQHFLLEAAKLVLAQRPNTRFVIIGQGALDAQLRQQARDLGIAERVEFTGVRQDIPDLLGSSDIFTLTSLWEGMPVTAVEAMAAARASVLTDVGANSEVIEHGVSGMIVPPRDVEGLARAYIELIDNPAKRLTMGRAARERVQRLFSMEQYLQQHQDLYTQLKRGTR